MGRYRGKTWVYFRSEEPCRKLRRPLDRGLRDNSECGRWDLTD